MSAIYSYDVTVTSYQNANMTLHVKAGTEAEALFQAGRQFSQRAYGDTATRADEVLYATIMRGRVSHLTVTRTD